jgi:hypothetical protein
MWSRPEFPKGQLYLGSAVKISPSESHPVNSIGPIRRAFPSRSVDATNRSYRIVNPFPDMCFRLCPPRIYKTFHVHRRHQQARAKRNGQIELSTE